MLQDDFLTTPIESLDSLAAYLAKGEKPQADWQIGVEHEKIPFYRQTRESVPYGGEKGIAALLQQLQHKMHLSPLYDGKHVIGLQGSSTQGAISLEPGGQVELSGAPLVNLHKVKEELQQYFTTLAPIIDNLGMKFLALGASPLWENAQIHIMPKERYNIMRHYMPKVGKNGLDMMLRTATVQVNLDFADEEDMRRKMAVAMKLQPVATALFANSPFSGGKPNGYLSWRSHVWQHTDKQRTGILPFVFDKNFGYAQYADWALDCPMYFIRRNKKYYDFTGVKFRDFLLGTPNAAGQRFTPIGQDFADHLTTLFPEVRLKQYLEMRGADAGPLPFLLALPAFWTGLLYDKEALNAAESLTKDFTFADVNKMYQYVPQRGLRAPFQQGCVLDIARQVLPIAQKGLVARAQFNKNRQDESIFLEPLLEISKTGLTAAEKLLQSYHTSWNKDIYAVFEQCTYEDL